MPPRPAHLIVAGQAGQASSAPIPLMRIPASLAAAVGRCWRKAAAPAEWDLTLKQFEAALERSVAQRFSQTAPNAKAIEEYLEALHAQDLALALACSAGNPAAWDFFVAQFRPELYRAARAIVGHGETGDSAARELADSLYADLYGLSESEGRRKSLFNYFHGRSKLSTWLRAVLAQRYVDEIRRTRRTEPLENEAGEERSEIAPDSKVHASPKNATPDPERTKYLAILQTTLTAALAALDPRDRLRLAYYYADDRTLAEIGKLFGEHEATVSRKLERTRRDVRARVESALRDGKQMSAEQVRLCCEYARDEWPFDLTVPLRSTHPPGADAGPTGQARDGLRPGARKI